MTRRWPVPCSEVEVSLRARRSSFRSVIRDRGHWHAAGTGVASAGWIVEASPIIASPYTSGYRLSPSRGGVNGVFLAGQSCACPGKRKGKHGRKAPTEIVGIFLDAGR